MSRRRRLTWLLSRSAIFLVASIGLLPSVIATAMAAATELYWRSRNESATTEVSVLAVFASVALLFEVLVIFLVFGAQEPRHMVLRGLAVCCGLLAVIQSLRTQTVVLLLWTVAGAGILFALLRVRSETSRD